jgi:hypothetical protein
MNCPKFNQTSAAVPTSDIDAAIYRYLCPAKRASAKESILNIRRLITRAGALQKAIEILSPHNEYAILGEPAMGGIAPRALQAELTKIITQAKIALRRARKPNRGPRRHNAQRQLLAELGILWAAANPKIQRGICAVKGERLGPMLDFVCAELKRASVKNVGSEEAIGKKLYEMRRLIAEKAAAERLKANREETAGRFMLTVRE